MSHKSLNDLDKQITNARNKVEVGGIYYHYKDLEKYYLVESIGLLEESEEVCVIYRALYGKGILWVRTLENFLGEVNDKPRFKKI